ncbi:uncharacterized protein LOC143246766 isoform X2 [Tachypleus tridentatus]|uniref:uncharacterized protein LOC143246766 isoform X2 n=1 Tax=Tachypleus tridentatus TaxID=6853 RepID=UPI003FD3492D
MALVRELPISRAFSSVYDVLLLHKANYCYVSFTLISPFGRPMERIATQYMKGDSQVTFQDLTNMNTKCVLLVGLVALLVVLSVVGAGRYGGYGGYGGYRGGYGGYGGGYHGGYGGYRGGYGGYRGGYGGYGHSYW